MNILINLQVFVFLNVETCKSIIFLYRLILPTAFLPYCALLPLHIIFYCQSYEIRNHLIYFILNDFNSICCA